MLVVNLACSSFSSAAWRASTPLERYDAPEDHGERVLGRAGSIDDGEKTSFGMGERRDSGRVGMGRKGGWSGGVA